MSEEILDIFTRDGKLIGAKPRSECHVKNPGFYHRPSWIWIYNSNGEILVQKRAMAKKNWPGYYDMPAAGHVESGESPLEGAIRETKEEIGLDLRPEDLTFAFEYIHDSSWELGQVYFVKCDKKAEEFKLQEKEVELVKWLSFDDFKKLLYSDAWVPYAADYKALIVKELKKILTNEL